MFENLNVKGPEDWFTGDVRIDPLYAKKEFTKGSGALVTFEAGARTAWHAHPGGQTLIVRIFYINNWLQLVEIIPVFY
jgi:quercetin dioxygenase-like cupin family protein